VAGTAWSAKVSRHGGDVWCTRRSEVPPVINSAAEVRLAARAAATVVGDNHVDSNAKPIMGSEDFAFMLEAKLGAYLYPRTGQRPRRLHDPLPTL
jgi:metal-dependent amidase/aminoacylase/carboxypeptidase family protein